ncbi:MAG TPA: M56 family metallopeptidase [Candidatus Eremiobacteraceae bacterium]|nr:M56 family metallopeptidase [Candidatus Eremiobacteraceae bacterium]
MIADIVSSLLNASWQGVVLFGVVWSLIRIARRSSASTRYALWFAVLVGVAALPAIDFALAATHSATSITSITSDAPSLLTVAPVRPHVAAAHVRTMPVIHMPSAHAGLREKQYIQPIVAAPASETGPLTGAARTMTAAIADFTMDLTRFASSVFIAWSIVALLLLARLFFSFARLMRIKRELTPCRDAAILSVTQGSTRAVDVGVSAELAMPCLLGFSRPVIALPRALFFELPIADLARIVRHEHAHVRRWDDIGNAVQQIVKSVYWLCPAMHMICRMLDIEREIACDDFAVVPLEERVQYAKCLTHLAVDGFKRVRPLPAPCLFFSRKQLLVRVERLLEQGHNGATSIARLAAYGIGILAIAICAVARFQLPVFAAPPTVPTPPAASERAVVPRVPVSARVQTAPIAAPAHLAAIAARAARPHAPALAAATAIKASATAVSATAAATKAAAAALASMHPAVMVMAKHFAFTAKRLEALRVATMEGATAPRLMEIARPASAARLATSTTDLLDALSRAGYPTLPVDDLIRLKDVGVTGDLVDAAVAYSGSRPSADLLVRLASVGVDGDYLRSLPGLGISHMDLEAVVRMKSIGIDPAYVREMDAVLKTRPMIDDLVRLRSVGVDPEYVRGMNAASNSNESVEDLVQLRSLGVDPGYVHDVDAAMNTRLSLVDLMRLRSVGVDAGYIRSFQALGYNKLSAEDLVRLRSVGVDAEYVRMLRSKGIGGSAPLSIEELIRLRTAGV